MALVSLFRMMITNGFGSIEEGSRSMARFPLLVATVMLLESFLASNVQACGGHWCRWCWHHRHVVVAPQPTHYAIPQQYYVRQANDVDGASRSLIDNIKLAIDLAGIIRGINPVQPQVGGGNSSGSGNNSADYDRLSRRIDELQRASEKNAAELRGLVDSESALGNRVQKDLDTISDRLEKLEQASTKRDAELARTIIDSINNTIVKESRKAFAESRLTELKDDLERTTRKVAELQNAKPMSDDGKRELAVWEYQKKVLEEKISKLDAK